MEISGKNIWQQAAGNNDRSFAGICLKWDIILNGPGYAGAWPACIDALREDGFTAKKITGLRRFAMEVEDGDLVVLRSGTASILGVGEIVGLYEWNDAFGDVDGWSLEHTRRVRWLWNGLKSPKFFDTYALKLGDTTQRLNDGPVVEWLKTLEIDISVQKRELAYLPELQDRDMTLEKIAEFLFDEGVASASIAKLTAEMDELKRIAKWYQRSTMPSEHETVAYLVVPLLRALGWTPQKMAVEWNYVDVALFGHLPRSDDTLHAVVEAKKMDKSCLSAISQAMNYARDKAFCNRLILTDGLRYGVFTRTSNQSFKLHAYLNIARLQRDYPIYECEGAQQALLAMTPEWRAANERQVLL